MDGSVKALVYGTIFAYQDLSPEEKKKAYRELSFKVVTANPNVWPNHVRAGHIFLRIFKAENL